MSLVCRERSARQVCEGLACALSSRWRKAGDSFVLEPVDPAEALSASELAVVLGASLGLPGTQYGHGLELPLPDLLGSLAETQLQAAVRKEGLPFALLLPEQQQQFLRRIMQDLPTLLSEMGACLEDLSRLDSVRVTLERQEGTPTPDGKTTLAREYLMIRGASAYTLWLKGAETK